MRRFFRSKIHRATVTQADLRYEDEENNIIGFEADVAGPGSREDNLAKII